MKRFDKVIKNFGRNHDSVAVGADFFGDAHHSASGVALEVDEECFAVCNDFFCTNDIVVHCSDVGAWLYDPRPYNISGKTSESIIKWTEPLNLVIKIKKNVGMWPCAKFGLIFGIKKGILCFQLV